MQERKERLRKLLLDFMESNNLSGRQLARHLKISPTSVTGYLDGTTYPSAESRKAIAVALGRTPAELDAYLEDVPLIPENSADALIQDIRALNWEDFLRVVQAVWERLMDEVRIR